MSIESSHLNLNFENDARKLAAVEEERQRREKKGKKLGPIDERIMVLKTQYETLLDNNGFMPDSPIIKEFIRISEHSLSSYPEAIENFREEIKLLDETKFGRSDKPETTH